MKKKYNIAFLPVYENNSFVSLARKFSDLADTYILGEKSLPHITLIQFYGEDSQIDILWEKIKNNLSSTIGLELNSFSYVTFDNEIFWASLLPDNRSELILMHNQISKLINQPKNLNYDPHLTLINTKDKNYQKKIRKEEEKYKTIKDYFILSLGESDDIGQFQKILYQSEVRGKIFTP